MVETWIGALTARWATINPAGGSSGAFGRRQVRSFNMITDDDFPEAIQPATLADTPLALTYPPMLRPNYSQGGPRTAIWIGRTEFHLAPDLSRKWIRELLPWYQLILNAAAAIPTLGNGLVELFKISDDEDGISELGALQYGDESLHWGLVVKWSVKEHFTLTVGGPDA